MRDLISKEILSQYNLCRGWRRKTFTPPPPPPPPPSNSLPFVPKLKFCCGSLLSAFDVRVSVTFHLTCVHIILSSVWAAEWPPFFEIGAHSVDHKFFLYFDYL